MIVMARKRRNEEQEGGCIIFSCSKLLAIK